MQCGFCTPGFVVAIHDLLDRVPRARPARGARGAGRQPVPLHRLRPHPRRGRAGRGRAHGGGHRHVRPRRRRPVTDLQTPPTVRGGPADGRVGDSPVRPDGTPKVQGRFAFSSDLHADGMLWGRTLRSPHPHARITSIDVGPALAIAGVACVVTADDVPGAATYGLISADQPVFARDVVRFVGEPVAAVAADHPDTARRALDAIAVDLRGRCRRSSTPRPPPPRRADPPGRQRHPPHRGRPRRRRGGRRRGGGRGHLRGRHAGPGVPRARVRPGRARRRGRGRPVGRDPVAARGPRPGGGLPRPAARAGAAAPRRRRRRLRRAGGREHAGPRLPAGAGRRAPGEDELPAGRVVPRPRPPPSGPHALPPPRHPRRRPREGRGRGRARRRGLRLVVVRRRRQRRPLRLRALPGARTPTSTPSCVRTNNPPCGAMRGFGAVQVVLRPRGADGPARRRGWASTRSSCGCATRSARATCCPPASGSRAPRRWPSASGPRPPIPLPPPAGDGLLERPGGAGRTDDPARTRRGVGFAVGFKNLLYSEGFDDTSEARVRLDGRGGHGGVRGRRGRGRAS